MNFVCECNIYILYICSTVAKVDHLLKTRNEHSNPPVVVDKRYVVENADSVFTFLHLCML